MALCLVGVVACGIKGPPRPPLAAPSPTAPAPDGGARISYRAGTPTRDATGLVLLWLAQGPIGAGAQLLLERHVPHAGDDGPACGQRLVVARIRAQARLQWRVEAGTPLARYRLLHEDGSPAGEVIDATAIGPR